MKVVIIDLETTGLDPETCQIIEKVVGVGKNFGSFDLQFIKKLEGYGELVEFHHRNLDPGSLYTLPTDDVPPSIDECLRRAGINKETKHSALDDCTNLLIRKFRSK